MLSRQGRRSVVRFSGRIGRVTDVVVRLHIFWCRFFKAVYDGSNEAILSVRSEERRVGKEC